MDTASVVSEGGLHVVDLNSTLGSSEIDSSFVSTEPDVSEDFGEGSPIREGEKHWGGGDGGESTGDGGQEQVRVIFA